MENIIASIDTMAAVVISVAVVGVVELIKRAFDRDWRAVATISTAAIVGALIAIPVGVSWYIGLVLGISGSGITTITGRLNKNEQTANSEKPTG